MFAVRAEVCEKASKCILDTQNNQYSIVDVKDQSAFYMLLFMLHSHILLLSKCSCLMSLFVQLKWIHEINCILFGVTVHVFILVTCYASIEFCTCENTFNSPQNWKGFIHYGKVYLYAYSVVSRPCNRLGPRTWLMMCSILVIGVPDAHDLAML